MDRKRDLDKQTRLRKNKKGISTYISIPTMKINGLISPIKRHRQMDWIIKIRPTSLLPTKNTCDWERCTQTVSKRIKNDILCNWNRKARTSFIHIQQSRHQEEICRRDKESHYILMKGTKFQEAITVNIFGRKHQSMQFDTTNSSRK